MFFCYEHSIECKSLMYFKSIKYGFNANDGCIEVLQWKF